MNELTMDNKNINKGEFSFQYEIEFKNDSKLLEANNKFDQNFSGGSFRATDFIDEEKIKFTNYEDLINIKFNEKVDANDKWDYAVSIVSGIFCGATDIFYIKGFSLENAKTWGDKQVNEFVLNFTKSKGYKGNDLNDAIRFLEDCFKIPADYLTSVFGGGLQHHLRDFEHHPTVLGLFFSMLTQFTYKGFGTNTNDDFII